MVCKKRFIFERKELLLRGLESVESIYQRPWGMIFTSFKGTLRYLSGTNFRWTWVKPFSRLPKNHKIKVPCERQPRKLATRNLMPWCTSLLLIRLRLVWRLWRANWFVGRHIVNSGLHWKVGYNVMLCQNEIFISPLWKWVKVDHFFSEKASSL